MDGLNVVGYCNGFTLWHYTAPEYDDPKSVVTPKYFNRGYDRLCRGDIVHVFFPGRTLGCTGILGVDQVTDSRDVVVSAMSGPFPQRVEA